MPIFRILRLNRQHMARLLLLVILTTASSVVLLVVPWMAGHLLGTMVTGQEGALKGAVGVLAACLVAIAMLSFLTADRMVRMSAALLAELRERIFDHVQRLPMAFHDSRGKGDMLAVMTIEIAKLSEFVAVTLVAVPARLLTAIGAMIVMFTIDARLALLIPTIVPLFYLATKIVGRRLQGLAVQIQQADARAIALSDEALQIVPATKAFGQEAAQYDRYRQTVRKLEGLMVRQGRIYAALDPLISLIAAFAALAVLWFAGHDVSDGRMTASELFSFMFYAALLTRPVGSLAHLYGQIQTARGALARLSAVLAEPTEDVGAAQASRRPRAHGAIEFRNVHFAYAGRDPVLTGVDLRVGAAERIAILGANGAGKTAMINLLMRYYDPQVGAIFVDGEDSRTMGLSALRDRIGLVPQSALLFNATIRENIAFGAVGASQQMIDDAARLAQALDFVASLPYGMDTVIGDCGLRLSGGQRQRIALARALIKDPAIIIFDEATSMFDDEGEEAFIDACNDALHGRTVILVTHRPATLALANRIVTLEDGRIRELRADERRLQKVSA
ncbi:ABC transporter ATP-binding protein [Sphingomonas lutea]